MKKLVILFSALLFTQALCYAQVNVFKAAEKFQNEMPDSVKYAVEKYSQGRIVYKDGSYSNGIFNIGTIDQIVRFMDTDGSIKVLTNNDEVDRITLAGKLFFHYANGYYELTDMAGAISLCLFKKVSILDDVKTGAYGMQSETTNIKQYSGMVENGTGKTYDYSSSITAQYKYKEIPFLYKNGAFYTVSKKRLQKFFPQHKSLIEQYCSENPVDFTEFKDVAKLFELLK